MPAIDQPMTHLDLIGFCKEVRKHVIYSRPDLVVRWFGVLAVQSYPRREIIRPEVLAEAVVTGMLPMQTPPWHLNASSIMGEKKSWTWRRLTSLRAFSTRPRVPTRAELVTWLDPALNRWRPCLLRLFVWPPGRLAWRSANPWRPKGNGLAGMAASVDT